MLSRRTAALLVASILLVGCTSANESGDQPGAPVSQSAGPGSAIQQPRLPSGIPVAPDSKRVHLKVPTFSRPTDVTNPLFPLSKQHAVVIATGLNHAMLDAGDSVGEATALRR
jgi:hypothetical protein